jgi:hypothetical protein
VQLARAYGQKGSVDQAKGAYQAFFKMGPEASAAPPLLEAARAEFERLK